MHGNMQLITELYKHSVIKDQILVTCIEDLFEELNTQNVEILSKMVGQLAEHKVNKSKQERREKHEQEEKDDNQQ